MREMKFRGKDYSGQWVYGDLLQLNDGDVQIGVHGQYIDDGYHFNSSWNKCVNVNEETIGQYTGLRDKYGKEIYEGDIIRSYDSENNPIIHYIQWHNSNACYVAIIPQYPCTCSTITKDWIEEYDKKIIGNIHDNPELIKEER